MKRDIFDFLPKDLADRPIAEDANESLKDRPTTEPGLIAESDTETPMP